MIARHPPEWAPESVQKIEGETRITSFTIWIRHVLDEAYHLDHCSLREKKGWKNESMDQDEG